MPVRAADGDLRACTPVERVFGFDARQYGIELAENSIAIMPLREMTILNEAALMMTALRCGLPAGWFRTIEKFSRHAAPPKAERSFEPSNLSDAATEEAHMPAIIIPVLWVGGAAILLGGGWYVIGHMVH